MEKVLFMDRDGTILIEPADEQVDSFKKMALGVIKHLGENRHRKLQFVFTFSA